MRRMPVPSGMIWANHTLSGMYPACLEGIRRDKAPGGRDIKKSAFIRRFSSAGVPILLDDLDRLQVEGTTSWCCQAMNCHIVSGDVAIQVVTLSVPPT